MNHYLSARRLSIAALCLASMQLPNALAQKFPGKPLRILVTIGPGSVGDIISRVLADPLSRQMGQTVVVDNRPGAGGNVAAEIAAKSPADGYTLFLTTISTHGINPTLYGKLNFDPIRDFTPVILLATNPNMMVVHPSLPVRSAKELIALAKKRPGEVTFSSAGSGTSQHIAGELFGMITGTKLVHVPYKSTPLSVNAVLSGETMVAFASVPVVMEFVKAGRLRSLGVTSAKRMSSLPDMPTVAETGVAGFDIGGWFGFSVPAGTPEPIVNQLNGEFRKAMADPGVRQKLQAQGMELTESSPTEFAAFIRSEIERWAKVVRATGARVD
ncbi:MAG: tripartite tricarboxylate transporter substrate binding protein [Proteobacteria bacterium]|nr:tripartite tricarboxylate transporter substrate binding protein [Burkholderiales bacterium]